MRVIPLKEIISHSDSKAKSEFNARPVTFLKRDLRFSNVVETVCPESQIRMFWKPQTRIKKQGAPGRPQRKLRQVQSPPYLTFFYRFSKLSLIIFLELRRNYFFFI